MGCFFGCFRVKDDNRSQTHLVSDTVSSKSRDTLESGNNLASLFLFEEKEGSPCKDRTHQSLESLWPDVDGEGDNWEFKDEAKFLKACGTLLETPAEIRRASKKVKDPSLHDGDSEPSKFYSWLPGASITKLHLEEQPDQVPISPVKLCEVLGKDSSSPEYKHISCMSNGQKLSPKDVGVESPHTAIKVPVHQIANDTFSSVTLELPTVVTQCKNKYVRFECELDSDMSSVPSSCQSLKQADFPSGRKGFKHSPFPTPLKLTDEMQTPGTVYPANLENLANGKNARIRSQYVYPVLKPVENFSQWKALKEEDSNRHHQISLLGDSIEHCENASPEGTSASYSRISAKMHKRESGGKEFKLDASLSHCLKPSARKDDNGQNCETISNERSHSGKTTDQERPILGAVAAHWNDDEPSCISPKWWDGNGIPNSTNKYKEHQKVSWHGTPFVERLEKALSNETLVCQRKHFNKGPIDSDETEESDIAVSNLQSATHIKPVVSF